MQERRAQEMEESAFQPASILITRCSEIRDSCAVPFVLASVIYIICIHFKLGGRGCDRLALHASQDEICWHGASTWLARGGMFQFLSAHARRSSDNSKFRAIPRSWIPGMNSRRARSYSYMYIHSITFETFIRS
jgi:hypothetical protein